MENPKDMTIRLGETWRSESDNDLLPHIDRKIESILIHPEYSRNESRLIRSKLGDPYDIALLKLSKPIEYSMHVVPICLPKDKDHLVPCHLAKENLVRF